MKTLLASPLAALVLAAAGFAAPQTAEPAAAGAGAPAPVTLPELGLTLTLPELADLKETRMQKGILRGTWRGKLGETRVTVELSVFPNEEFGLGEPDDVAALLAGNASSGPDASYKRTGIQAGPYGFAPFAVLATSTKHLKGSTRPDTNAYYLCGLLEQAGYVIAVECRPALEGEAAAPIHAFLKDGVRYAGTERVHAWTDEEALARFLHDAPEDCHDEFEKIVRTKHYIVLTNSSSGDKFGKKMEECYTTIQKIFPFDEVDGRKLMPVFLFQTNEEYYDFCTKIAGWDRTQAMGTKGHAWRDYYATWYEAPQDPVHIHEATHQIFGNRLGLNGGGSWFQEGMAEYVETTDNDRNAIATQVKKGRAMPLRDFVVVRTLAFEGDDVKGGNQAGDLYKQAALLVEFLRESELGKPHFQRFVHTMGKVSRDDLASIEAVIREIYGMDLAQLDAEFQAYCKKR